MYVEFLKALVLVGIVVKSLAARFWVGALVAAATLYVSVGLVAIAVFARPWPLLSDLVGTPARVGLMLAVLLVEVVASVAIWAWQMLAFARGTARREIGDLFALHAICIVLQVGLVALL